MAFPRLERADGPDDERCAVAGGRRDVLIIRRIDTTGDRANFLPRDAALGEYACDRLRYRNNAVDAPIVEIAIEPAAADGIIHSTRNQPALRRRRASEPW